MNRQAQKLIFDNADAGDIPEITRIYRDAVIWGKASFELQPPDENELLRRFNELVDNGYPYLVARMNDAVAGYAYAGPYRSRPGYYWSVENSVYVDPDYRNMGIGLSLLNHLIQLCTQRDFRQMIAIIGDSANISSIRLHEKAGFVHAGTLVAVGRKHETWLDSVTMQLELGEGQTTPPKQQ